MRRSENNVKVDVAVRLRRAWSAPAAPLSHIRSSHVVPSFAEPVAAGGISNRSIRTGSSSNSADGNEKVGLVLPRAVYRLFPTQTSFSLVDISYEAAAEEAPTTATVEAATSPTSSAAYPLPSHDDLWDELQAAKHQILLLSAASAQSFSSYAALESENALLKQLNAQLQEENDALKEKLAQRDDEISEQLHLICELEKKLKEFSSLTLTRKSGRNGRSNE